MNIENKITEIFLEISMRPNQIGYEYAKAAIKGCLNDEISFHCMMGVYETVAKKFNSTSSRVERGIRHSIESAWGRIDPDVSYKYFKNSISPLTRKPTNSLFIATIVDFIKRESVNE